MPRHPIDAFMTPAPVSIGVHQPLSAAAALMRERGFRHLPVVEGSALRGVISERDVLLAQSLAPEGADWPVERAMTDAPYTVPPDTALGEVVRVMGRHKIGSAVICDRDGKVIGILTSTDAMRVMAELLGAGTAELAPSEIRQRVLDDHARLSALLEYIEGLVKRLDRGERSVAPRLHQWMRDLHAFVRAHIALEDRILAPAIRDADGFGPARLEEFSRVHEAQKQELAERLETMRALDDTEELGKLVRDVVALLREDMRLEEKMFLSETVLRDHLMPTDTFGG